ncbi:hypothetical protein D3C72_456020 [compost metagenome]
MIPWLLSKATLPIWAWLTLLSLPVSLTALLPGGLHLLSFLASVLLLVVIPGVVLARTILRASAPALPALLGWGTCLGVSAIALLYSIAPLFDFPLSRLFWWSYALLALGTGVSMLWRARIDLVACLTRPWAPAVWPAVLAIGVLAALAAKLGAVMGIANPPLHDPASHALMAKLVADAGYIPWNQLPFRGAPFFYPPGLASLVAAFHGFSGLEIPKLVLFWTNLSTVFAGLAAFALISRLTGSPGAGVYAFGFLTFLSLMPTGEFYLAGKNSSVVSNFLFLGVLLAAFTLRHRPSKAYGLITALLLSACFLFHYEKIIFLVVFFLAYAIASLAQARRIAWIPFVLTWLETGVVSLLLVSPWLYRLHWASAQARLSGTALVPDASGGYMGTAFRPGALLDAMQSFWGPVQQYSDPSLVWMALLAPLAFFFASGALDLMVFMLGIALFHPAVVEPLGFSMATLSYDRIVIHFAYLPVSLLASLGLWGLWRVGVTWLPARVTRLGHQGLLGLAALLFIYAGWSHASLYQRVSESDALDAHDLEAFAWIARNLPRQHSFIVPIPEGDAQRRHYFIQKAGLYLPVYTGHDVVGHFIRIETPQIEREYQQYLSMLEQQPAGRESANRWFYTRDDDPYYASLNRWLDAQPSGRFRERYRNAHVRVLEYALGERETP